MDLPMTKWTPEELAHRALLVLKDRPYHIDTRDVAKFVARAVRPDCDGLHNRDYVALREVLNRLHAAGKVDKVEKSKAVHKWGIEVDEWSEYNPFKPAEGFVPKEGLNRIVEKMADESENEDLSSNETDRKSDANVARLNDKITDLIQQNKNLLSGMEAMSEALAAACKLATDAEKKATEALAAAPKEVHIERYDGSVAILKDCVLPPEFDEVKDLVAMRMNVLLVGPAGCGKTRLAETVAEAFGLRFGSIACTAGMSEAHLLGRAGVKLDTGVSDKAEKGKKAKEPPYTPTEFVDIYENGGVFLFDEIDAADPNLLLCVNSALANGRLPLPNRGRPAVRHADFVPIATANTYGRGATRVYAGRNQLDDATLDRFRIGTVEMMYDPNVERAVCPDDDLRDRVQQVRERVMDTGMHRTVSTRFLIDAYKMRKGTNWDIDRILRKLTAGWTADELNKAGLGRRN